MLIESRTLIKLDPLHMFVSWSIRAICGQTETSPIIICIFFRCWPFGYFISIPIKRLRASFVSILVYDWSLIEDVLGCALFPHTLGSHLRFICSTLLLDYERGDTFTDTPHRDANRTITLAVETWISGTVFMIEELNSFMELCKRC